MSDVLNNASIADIAEFLRQRFQQRGPMAADSGTRETEFPHDLPLELWKQASAPQRRDICEAVAMLLDEIPGGQWTAEAVEWLVSFIDEARMTEAVLALQNAVESGRWLKAQDDGLRHQMVALRTLVDLGWAGTPGYWRGLPAELNARYPALAFRGLLRHGLDLAFAWLPHVATDPRAVRRIVDVLSSLVRDEGSEAVCTKLRSVCPQLADEVVDEFERWFTVHGWGAIQQPADATLVRATAAQQRAVHVCLTRAPDRPWAERRVERGTIRFHKHKPFDRAPETEGVTVGERGPEHQESSIYSAADVTPDTYQSFPALCSVSA